MPADTTLLTSARRESTYEIRFFAPLREFDPEVSQSREDTKKQTDECPIYACHCVPWTYSASHWQWHQRLPSDSTQSDVLR